MEIYSLFSNSKANAGFWNLPRRHCVQYILCIQKCTNDRIEGGDATVTEEIIRMHLHFYTADFFGTLQEPSSFVSLFLYSKFRIAYPRLCHRWTNWTVWWIPFRLWFWFGISWFALNHLGVFVSAQTEDERFQYSQLIKTQFCVLAQDAEEMSLGNETKYSLKLPKNFPEPLIGSSKIWPLTSYVPSVRMYGKNTSNV